jgi:hypothetical protein
MTTGRARWTFAITSAALGDCKNIGSGSEEVVGSACPDRVTGSGA